MVDCGSNECSSGQKVEAGFKPKVEQLDLELPLGPACVKPEPDEGNVASSSWSHLKSHFVAMGFSSALVEKVLEENGEDDVDLLLETLITYTPWQVTALQKSSSGSSDFQDGVSPCKNGSPVETSSCDSKDFEGLDGSAEGQVSKKDTLLRMNFSKVEVEMAINGLGEDASIPELVDFIIMGQVAEASEEKKVDVKPPVKIITTDSLFGTMDKTLCLLDMGFTEDEVSAAIDKFGEEVPIAELADSIFANQIAKACAEEDDVILPLQNQLMTLRLTILESSVHKVRYSSWNDTNSRPSGHCTVDPKKRPFHIKTEGESSSSNPNPHANDRFFKNMKGKRMKSEPADDKFDFYDTVMPEASGMKTETYQAFPEMDEVMPLKFEVPERPVLNRNHHHLVGKPPFFFYGNVANISQESWRKISQFLHGVEPEFVNSQFFSALIRKEGYVHNLPTSSRFHIVPHPPMTIEDALPHTRKWWPSWDTRKQLSCINSETMGLSQICERLGRILVDSRGVLSKEQQMDVLHQCKTLNLVWVGQHRLSPIGVDQVECILGYPVGHTRIGDRHQDERLKSLKNSFQTDTLGYHLSPLKEIYPDGVKVLCLFSGIGGAGVALHKLGIHLKCVVSVEASRVNQEIQKKWWQDTRQSGILKLMDDVQGLSSHKIESLIRQFGGFDVVIAGNPCGHGSGQPKIDGNCPVEVDFSSFFEFVRVWQRVRDTRARN
ncbi:DNA (cytosine-5-)-methyltransferase [Asimina triloba]